MTVRSGIIAGVVLPSAAPPRPTYLSTRRAANGRIDIPPDLVIQDRGSRMSGHLLPWRSREQYQAQKLVKKCCRPARIGVSGIQRYLDSTQPPGLQPGDFQRIPQLSDQMIEEMATGEPCAATRTAFAELVARVHRAKSDKMQGGAS